MAAIHDSRATFVTTIIDNLIAQEATMKVNNVAEDAMNEEVTRQHLCMSSFSTGCNAGAIGAYRETLVNFFTVMYPLFTRHYENPETVARQHVDTLIKMRREGKTIKPF